MRNEWIKRSLVLFTFLLFFFAILEIDAIARVGGGRSSGSRGSRSFSSSRPSSSSPASQPSQTPRSSQQQTQPSPNSPTPPVASSPQSGFWRSLGGGILGGLIGGMLFSSLGFGHPHGGLDGGIGLVDILLIGGLLFGVYWFFKRRRQAAAARAYEESSTEPMVPDHTSCGPTAYDQPKGADGDLERGLNYIRQMDSTFDEKAFQDLCMDHFFKIQGAWTNRDISGIKNLLTEEMVGIIQGDAEKLRAEKKVNRLENIAVRSVDITEAWEESGQDFITVRFYANLLDYVQNETTGEVLSGSKTDPVKFEEFWTFTRPVGNNPWKLSAIQQVE